MLIVAAIVLTASVTSEFISHPILNALESFSRPASIFALTSSILPIYIQKKGKHQ